MELVSSIPVTVIFIAVFALLQIPITVAVGLRRVKTGIHFLDGGDQILLQRMRAHSNFTETVPMTLLAMAAAETAGAPPLLLWTGGSVLLAGRLLHYGTLVTSPFGNGRAVGMILTLTPLFVFPAYVLLAVAGLTL
ncbi:MAPEG family protein [Roseibium salinum]|uniref:MAPEG family protein n=1 Tax=Roseibium salinum TaxID=1604349 RepID=A0ABT3R4R0_9HYPH|nr:MAPEG family protein [Roseibium sp. DSM 29163]MCX2724058.1 MAPEG family protein [Roseibium sp. DSM 29163]MDN3718137.1 MAPEG family protein [Roseibium salinum]